MLSTSQTLFKYIQFLTLTESFMEVELSVTPNKVNIDLTIREGAKKRGESMVFYQTPLGPPPPGYGLFSGTKIDPHFFGWKLHL